MDSHTEMRLWETARDVKHRRWAVAINRMIYKKLSCRRETARRFVSLDILLSHSGHSRSFEMTLLSRACVSPISISLKLCLYVVRFLRYSASKNGVTLKLAVGVVQSHWKWRRSIDYTTFYWSAIVSIAVSFYFSMYLLLFINLWMNEWIYVVPFLSYLTLNNHDL